MDGHVKHTNTCYFTMVAKGEDDKPTLVPKLILQNKTDVRRFVEAIRRKKYKQEYSAIMGKIKKNPDDKGISAVLEGQRCLLHPKLIE